MKRSTIFSLVALLIILLAATVFLFWFADFHVARSATDAQHQASTYRSGDELPAAMQGRPPLQVAVAGEGLLAEELRQALPDQLLAQVPVSTVEVIDGAPDEADGLYLRVEVGERDVLWTPIYGDSEILATMAYASDGDVSFRHDDVVVMNRSPLVYADGEFELADESWGLLSRPAYYGLLAEALATDIGAALAPVFEPPPGS